MGKLTYRAVIHSHGGRARAINTSELSIDLAVLAAAAADEEGNATGCHGPSAFGSMGYAIMDARYAITRIPSPIQYTDRVVAVVEYRDGTTIDVIKEIKH